MNELPTSPLLRVRFAVAIAAGLLLAASFPKWGVAGFAWLAPGLMLAAALGLRGTECFQIGYVAGLTHYLASLYWLLLIPYRWHGIPLGPATGWLALGAFLALFPGAWVWLMAWRRRRRTWPGRTLWAISGATAWVAWEMVLARIFGGFSWDLLGVSQYRMTPLIQVASVTGVYGVSFIVVWLSLSLVSAGTMVMRRPGMRAVWIGEIFLPMIAVALLFNAGLRRLRHESIPLRTLKVALVQPSIPQTLIWDESNDEKRFHDLVRLSEEAMTNHPDLLVWPEAAVPKLLRYDQETFDSLTNLAGSNHAWLIIGADDMEQKSEAGKVEERTFFNSSFLIGPDGRLMDRYLKRNLVIFGEYIPLEKWLPIFKWFTPIPGGFRAGEKPGQFELTDLAVQASVLICFEDTFPHLGYMSAGPQTDFLVNITNDGWFGEGAAQWQHAATALFRAVENGVPLIRCTNTGLTCWIDSLGRMQDVFKDANGSVYGAGFLMAEIPLREPSEKAAATFYNRHGDWFGWLCVGLGMVLTGFRLTRVLTATVRSDT